MQIRLTWFFVAAVAAGTGAAILAADWPMWGGTPARTMFNLGKDPPVD